LQISIWLRPYTCLVSAYLKKIEPEYGKDVIEAALKRFWEADQEVYKKTMEEHARWPSYAEARTLKGNF